uniref:Uncharacterized protein n=1 Tax=Arundo donax TaxID=35708 RepID=A0A0A9AWY5_ARUDO
MTLTTCNKKTFYGMIAIYNIVQRLINQSTL